MAYQITITGGEIKLDADQHIFWLGDARSAPRQVWMCAADYPEYFRVVRRPSGSDYYLIPPAGADLYKSVATGELFLV